MSQVQDIHIQGSSCPLCKADFTAGSKILGLSFPPPLLIRSSNESPDLSQNLLVVPECKSPCLICSRRPYPRVWFHQTCYDTLMSSYEPSERPTLQGLRWFADATRPLHKSQQLGRREQTASILEGLSSDCTEELMQDVFRRDLFNRLPESRSFWDFLGLMHRRVRRSHKQWIYFPLNRQEYVKAAWVRVFTICPPAASDPVLIVSSPPSHSVSMAHIASCKHLWEEL